MNPTRQPPHSEGPVSSILEKIARGFRERVDRAIIDRDPPAIKDVMIRFQVRSNGVSKSAFYRYAARLRATAALEQSAELAADGRDPYDSMSALLDSEFQRTFNLGSDPAPATPPKAHSPPHPPRRPAPPLPPPASPPRAPAPPPPPPPTASPRPPRRRARRHPPRGCRPPPQRQKGPRTLPGPPR